MCVRVRASRLFLSLGGPLGGCKRAGAIYSREHVEVQLFTVVCAAVSSICLSLRDKVSLT